MAVYDLDNDEAVILQTSGVFTGTNASVDLILTNKNLIQVNKGFFGGDKGSIKYPLSELKVLNGKANILVGKARNGTKRLELYFSNCEVYYRFNAPFALNKWAGAIGKAHKDRMDSIAKSQKAPKTSLLDSVKGTLDKIVPGKEPQIKTCKCSKCGAELTGNKGEQVICSYCDNAVIIK